MSFKNGVLEATGLEFGASGLDFGGFGLDFEVLECSKTGFEKPWTYFGFVF